MLAASDGEVTGEGEVTSEVVDPDKIVLDPGQQAIVAVPSMASPLAFLPDAAFENLLVATVRSPAKVQRHVESRGLDPKTVGVVPLSNSTVDYAGPLWTSRRVSPTDLTGISIECSRGGQYLRRGEGWFVLDNVHTLLMYSDEGRVYRLLDALRQSFDERDVRGIYAIVRDTVGDEYGRYRALFDEEICRE